MVEKKRFGILEQKFVAVAEDWTARLETAAGPEFLSQPGGNVYVVEAPVWESSVPELVRRDHLLLGITPKTLKAHAAMGLSVRIGQLYGVVTPGIIFTKYLFRGLKRGMMVGASGGVDSQKLAASWDQPRDAFLGGDPQNVILKFRDAPPGSVFVVYISKNEVLKDFPAIYGWLEHWTWVASDPNTLGAPVDYKTRYEEVLWVAP
jgi:hypothetical protein